MFHISFTFISFIFVTFPKSQYFIGRKSKMKHMVYIIQNRMIWILYDDRRFREYYIPKYLPSWREEPRKGVEHFILKNRCSEEYWRPITVIKKINNIL